MESSTTKQTTDGGDKAEAARKGEVANAAPSTPQQPGSVDPMTAEVVTDNAEERKAHDERSERWKKQLDLEKQLYENQHEEVPDPYAAVNLPGARLVAHEGMEKDGKVPLHPGLRVNPPGSIPRAPGEWPTGALPPENPLGRRTSNPTGPEVRVSVQVDGKPVTISDQNRAPDSSKVTSADKASSKDKTEVKK